MATHIRTALVYMYTIKHGLFGLSLLSYDIAFVIQDCLIKSETTYTNNFMVPKVLLIPD